MSTFEPVSQDPDDEHKLFGEGYEALKEALEILYIRGNLSGRGHFLKAWPAAASYIFGPELIAMDTDGTTDGVRRNILEEESESRRFLLLETLETLEERSAKSGVLQKDYVLHVVETFGEDVARLLYAPAIFDRVLPQPPVSEIGSV